MGGITQIRTAEGRLYLAVLIDLYSRRVVGWATSTTIDAELCLRALDRAVETRQPSRGLVHHSDRGSQYASRHYQERLKKLGFRCSMSRKGNCYDNAVAESFFDSPKTERWDRAWHSNEAAHLAAMSYIDGFYNFRRLHSTLGYLTPDDFERHSA